MRIELWGEEIDSIRTFDPETQRSIENLEEVCICPAEEFPREEETAVSFLDYFPKEETILFLNEPVSPGGKRPRRRRRVYGSSEETGGSRV